MKKLVKKNCILALALTSIACAASAGVAMNSVNASASESATLPTTTAFNVSNVQIRFSQAGETSETSTGGIRFVTRVEKTAYESLGEVTEVGTLLFSAAANLPEDEMTVDSPKALKIVCEGEVDDEVRDGKFTVVDGETTYYEYRAYMYKIDATNYYDALEARSYAVIDGVTYYTSVVEKSVGAVATELLRDTKTEQVDEYQYEVSTGVYSPYSEALRNELMTYVFAGDTALGAPTVDEISYTQKVHYGEEVSIPAFTATDCLGEAASVSVRVLLNNEEVETSDGKFTVESYDAYAYEVTATDLEGRTTVKTYTVNVYEDNYLCSFTSPYHFIKTCGDVEIGGKTVHALGIQAKKDYKYANAAFAKVVDWANNYVSFKAYNPTSYTVKFRIWATKEAKEYSSSEWTGNYIQLQTVDLAAGATQEIVLDDWYDFETYPYLAIYMSASDNGGGGSEQHINTKFYMYDCTITEAVRVDPTTTADYKYAQGTGRNMDVLTNTDEAYVKEGLYSLKMTIGGTSSINGYVSETANVDMTTMESVSFSVYNSAEVDLPIYVSLGNPSTHATLSGSLRTEILPKGVWTDITVRLDTLQNVSAGLAVCISTSYYLYESDSTNPTYATYVNGKASVYLDNFQFTEKTTAVDFTSEDYLWANGTGVSNAYCFVNTNTAYCVEGSLYSWNILATGNYPTVKNEYSATIDWAKYSTLSFDVYNPTKYTIRYTIYLKSADGTTLTSKTLDINAGWNYDYTFDVSSATARTTGCYIQVYTGWGDGSNKKLDDDTTYSSAVNPIWNSMYRYGIYLDGFTLA